MANDFVIRISADDKATAVVKKIQSALGKITDPVEKVQKRVGRLGEVGNAGLEKLRKGLGSVAHAARTVVDRIVEIIPGLTALGGAASIAGLSALADKFANFGFGLNKSSKLLGVNAQDLAAWHVAANRAGVSADQFDSAMSGSQDVIRGAAFGANPQAMLILNKMGVQIQRNRDGSIDYLKTQLQIMDALRKQPSVQGQRDAANTLGYGALLPMIQQGTWNADKARAYRKGLVPTPEEIARAVEFHQNITDLEDSVTGLGNRIGSGLIPVLDPLIVKFSTWLDAHRVDIADKITGAVQKFSDWIQGIDWDSVNTKLKTFWDDIGGLNGVLLAIAAISLSGPIGGVLSLITNLSKLSTVAIPEALTGLTGLGLLGLGAGALFTIDKIKDSTEPGHFAGRNAGAANQAPLRGQDTNAALADGVKQGLTDFFSTQTGRFVSRSDSNAHGGTGGLAPLGIRSNNPLNILDHNNEITYATPEQGIAAAADNLRRGYRGLTLAQIVDKWTGGARTGNTPQQMANYVGILSSGTGLSADAVPDLNNQGTVAALLKAQIRAENGQQPYSDAQILAGISGSPGAVGSQGSAGADGASAADRASAAPASDASGHDDRVSSLQQHTVTFDFKNVPAGARVDAKTADGSYLPTKVTYAMPTSMGAMP
jgi:hypothetical protein